MAKYILFWKVPFALLHLPWSPAVPAYWPLFLARLHLREQCNAIFKFIILLTSPLDTSSAVLFSSWDVQRRRRSYLQEQEQKSDRYTQLKVCWRARKLLRRYLNGEGESVFFVHSFIHGAEGPEGKEKVRKEAYVLSLNLLPRKLLHLSEDLFLR